MTCRKRSGCCATLAGRRRHDAGNRWWALGDSVAYGRPSVAIDAVSDCRGAAGTAAAPVFGAGAVRDLAGRFGEIPGAVCGYCEAGESAGSASGCIAGIACAALLRL